MLSRLKSETFFSEKMSETDFPDMEGENGWHKLFTVSRKATADSRDRSYEV